MGAMTPVMTKWGRRFFLVAVVAAVAGLVYITESKLAGEDEEAWVHAREAAWEAMALASIGEFPPGTPLDWKEAEQRGALLPTWLPETVKRDDVRVLALPGDRFFTEFGRRFFLGQEPRSLVRRRGPDAPDKAAVLRKETIDVNGSPGVALYLQGGYVRLSWSIGEASFVLFSEEEQADMETLAKVARSIRPLNQNPS